MSYYRSDDFYDEIFDECKTKKEVVTKAERMIRGRDSTIDRYENDIVAIAEGNQAMVSALMKQLC
jgi:hypothetical protein